MTTNRYSSSNLLWPSEQFPFYFILLLNEKLWIKLLAYRYIVFHKLSQWLLTSQQMHARSLAMEIAPVIIWQKEQKPEFYRQYWNQPSKDPSKNLDQPPSYSAWDMLAGE